MLPATLAHEVRKQILHYLEATFHMRDPAVEQALRRFFLDPDNGLFKGPWLQLRRPFRLAADSGERFFDLPIPFMPDSPKIIVPWSRLNISIDLFTSGGWMGIPSAFAAYIYLTNLSLSSSLFNNEQKNSSL